MLRVERVSKSFGDKTVLRDVSLAIGKRQIVGLYGDSGIGKSTLAKIICGVCPPDGGRIELHGVPLWVNGVYQRRQGLGIQMVYQQPYAAFDPNQRIGRGFLELIRYHRLAADRAEADRMILDVITQMQLKPEVLTHLPHQISGGEAQRLSIGKLLLLKPSLLILDEATSMLDVSSQAVLVGLLREAVAKHDLSILWISHDLPLLRAVADEICQVENYELQRRTEP